MGARSVDRSACQSKVSALRSGPAVLAVVGEHRADPTRLLLLGDDGQYYTYGDESNDPVSVELTPDWIVDIPHAA